MLMLSSITFVMGTTGPANFTLIKKTDGYNVNVDDSDEYDVNVKEDVLFT